MTCVQGAGWRNVCGRVSMRGFIALVLLALGSLVPLQAQEPIKIGFGVSLTGGLASSGKAHLLSKQIWAEEINAKGGLLGRPVRLVYFDDQTNAANVPGIYSKLMDVDKVDLLMGHATNLIVAAMPHIMARKKMVMVLLALGSNAEFNYPKYFQSAPFGPELEGRTLQCVFRGREIDQAGAEDRGARRRGCRILQQRADRRPREREEIRAPDRL